MYLFFITIHERRKGRRPSFNFVSFRLPFDYNYVASLPLCVSRESASLARPGRYSYGEQHQNAFVQCGNASSLAITWIPVNHANPSRPIFFSFFNSFRDHAHEEEIPHV